jgi:single-strand DNA-binding protein
MSEQGQEQACNAVTLVGRVSGDPEEKTLPSGDVLLLWRVIVTRPPSRRPAPAGTRSVTTDTFDCVAWAAGVRRTAGAFGAGDVVRVEGALRRRFWRGEGGATSKCEVEVMTAKRLTRATVPS